MSERKSSWSERKAGSTINDINDNKTTKQDKRPLRYLIIAVVVLAMLFRIAMRVDEIYGITTMVRNVALATSATSATSAAVEKPKAMDRAVFAWEGVDRKGLKVLEEHDINTVLLDYNHSKDIKKLRSYNTLILAGDYLFSCRNKCTPHLSLDTPNKSGREMEGKAG